MNELPSCPLCGGDSQYDYPRHGGGLYRIGCVACRVWTPWRPNGSGEPERTWNRRPSPWVPVSERLPEHEECVLIGHPEGFVGEARFHKLSDNRIDWLFEPSPVRDEPWSGRRAVPAPTVWQPLPAPPKED